MPSLTPGLSHNTEGSAMAASQAEGGKHAGPPRGHGRERKLRGGVGWGEEGEILCADPMYA